MSFASCALCGTASYHRGEVGRAFPQRRRARCYPVAELRHGHTEFRCAVLNLGVGRFAEKVRLASTDALQKCLRLCPFRRRPERILPRLDLLRRQRSEFRQVVAELPRERRLQRIRVRRFRHLSPQFGFRSALTSGDTGQCRLDRFFRVTDSRRQRIADELVERLSPRRLDELPVQTDRQAQRDALLAARLIEQVGERQRRRGGGIEVEPLVARQNRVIAPSDCALTEHTPGEFECFLEGGAVFGGRHVAQTEFENAVFGAVVGQNAV